LADSGTKSNEWGRFFDAHAPDYMTNIFTGNTLAEVDFAVQELGLTPGMAVLDVGCGTGGGWISPAACSERLQRRHRPLVCKWSRRTAMPCVTGRGASLMLRSACAKAHLRCSEAAKTRSDAIWRSFG